MSVWDKTLAYGLGIVFTLLLTAWCIYAYPVVKQVFDHYALTQSVKAQSVDWTFQEVQEDDFRPFAHYKYIVDGHFYVGQELFQGYKYRNPYAANSDLPYLKEEYQVVSYAPREPNKSSLEMFFPKKRAIYACLLFALLSYFVCGGTMYTNYWLKKNQL